MAEYIKREEALRVCRDFYDWNAHKEIRSLPTADVVPVVHGRWEPVLEGVWNLPMPACVGWRCSMCGREEQYKEPYCHCGAKMDGE